MVILAGEGGMGLVICEHVKVGGGRCGSPALRGQHYCYFHAPAHGAIPSVNLSELASYQRARTPRPAQRSLSTSADQSVSWQRCRLSGDALAIQMGLSRLVQGICQGLLNARQAKILLAALTRAAADLRNGTATRDSAVTSNQLQLPIPGGSRAAPRRGSQQAPSLRLLGWSESQRG